jgi:site-specific recombinase XerC
MDLSAEEIQKNIAALKNKVGDARTGGKGSQRRKVKVVNKAAVYFQSNLGKR